MEPSTDRSMDNLPERKSSCVANAATAATASARKGTYCSNCTWRSDSDDHAKHVTRKWYAKYVNRRWYATLYALWLWAIWNGNDAAMVNG